MTEVILELINSQREVLKNVEKTLKELDTKHKDEVRVKLLEATNELCLENKSLKHEAVRRTMARILMMINVLARERMVDHARISVSQGSMDTARRVISLSPRKRG